MSEQTPAQQSQEQPPAPAKPDPYADAREIVATPTGWYRAKLSIMSVVFLGLGLWCARDGFIEWPRQAQEAIKAGKKPPQNEASIGLQKALAIGFVLLSPLPAAWALYNSRGRYRLCDGVLEVPGHPPIPLGAVRGIDNRRWEKKGIAYVSYELESGASGRFKVDDLAYQREPTDAIYGRIEEALDAREDSSARNALG